MLNNSKFISYGWGWKEILWNSEHYASLLFVKKSKYSDWQFCKVSKTFYLQQGELQVIYGKDEDLFLAKNVILKPGDSFHVPTGLYHQMLGVQDSYLFEFSTEHKEKDSIRIIKGD